MRTLIRNGTIVTADGSSVADVLVDGETVALIGADLPGAGITADETIDATGKYVIPGAIDVHTHMELPFGGTFAKDTFESGTRAAAFGGTTSIVDFAVQSRGASLREGLDAWHAKAEGNAVADYGFHMIMSDVNDATLAEMDGLVAEGVPDFKLFTAYPGVFYSDDGAIFRAMQQTAKNGGLIMMHAENGMAIDVVAAQTVDARHDRSHRPRPGPQGRLRGRGHEPRDQARRGGRGPGVHRPPVRQGRARPRSVRPATVARWRSPRRARSTCSCRSTTSATGSKGAKFVCSPPLRPKDHWEELWKGLVKDDLQVVSTDHCPFDFEGQKELGRGDFRKIPNGLPGVEDRVDLLHDGGVVGGRITRERWVEVISTAPAKLFGMYPRKGSVSVGADADLVIYDPNRRRTISAKTHHMDVDYSCYEGREVQGASDVVLSRGSVIVRNGEFTGRKGHGRFIKRSTADFARLA